MVWANYLFNILGDKADRLTHLASSTNAKIKERTCASTSSYFTELTEDTFRPGIVFKSFHYQGKTLISSRALLVGFLMLWLKQCVVLTLSYEVIVADVVYPAVLLAFGQNISLLTAMKGCIQSGLRAFALGGKLKECLKIFLNQGKVTTIQISTTRERKTQAQIFSLFKVGFFA